MAPLECGFLLNSCNCMRLLALLKRWTMNLPDKPHKDSTLPRRSKNCHLTRYRHSVQKQNALYKVVLLIWWVICKMLYGQEAPFTPTRLQFNNAKQPFNLNQVITTTNKYSKKKNYHTPFLEHKLCGHWYWSYHTIVNLNQIHERAGAHKHLNP